jgi:hypothetical protein
LGLASYYRRFIKNFAEIAYPLIELTKKKKDKLNMKLKRMNKAVEIETLLGNGETPNRKLLRHFANVL